MSETERRKARQNRNKQKNRMIKILAAAGMGVLAVLIIAGLALPSFGSLQQTGPQEILQRGGFFARPAPGPGEVVADQGRVHFDSLKRPSGRGLLQLHAGHLRHALPHVGTLRRLRGARAGRAHGAQP